MVRAAHTVAFGEVHHQNEENPGGSVKLPRTSPPHRIVFLGGLTPSARCSVVLYLLARYQSKCETATVCVSGFGSHGVETGCF